MKRLFALVVGVLVAIVLYVKCCTLRPEQVEGTYFHDRLGDRYRLILADEKFTQMLIWGNDTFMNYGEYSLSDVVHVSSWKEKEEIPDSSKGGCMGCELKYRNGRLRFYTDPDGGPEDVFVRQ